MDCSGGHKSNFYLFDTFLEERKKVVQFIVNYLYFKNTQTNGKGIKFRLPLGDKKADYIKAFKNKAVWKKQKHHLLLSRYCCFQMYI